MYSHVLAWHTFTPRSFQDILYFFIGKNTNDIVFLCVQAVLCVPLVGFNFSYYYKVIQTIQQDGKCIHRTLNKMLKKHNYMVFFIFSEDWSDINLTDLWMVRLGCPGWSVGDSGLILGTPGVILGRSGLGHGCLKCLLHPALAPDWLPDEPSGILVSNLELMASAEFCSFYIIREPSMSHFGLVRGLSGIIRAREPGLIPGSVTANPPNVKMVWGLHLGKCDLGLNL